MWRNLLLLGLVGIVLWDCTHSPPGKSALQGATLEFVEWAFTRFREADWQSYFDTLKNSLRAPEDVAAAVLPEPRLTPGPVAAPAPPIPVARSALSALPATPAPTPQTPPLPIPRESAFLPGIDSVFSRPAIDLYIAEASARTGVSADYLKYLAEHESAFNPVAEAGTSSAAGLYQFIEQTWLDVFAKYGAEHGQEAKADFLRRTADGLVTAPESERQAILDLRFDPKLATFLVARFTTENLAEMQSRLDRPIQYSELYIAHFLGSAGAVKLIRATEESPNTSAVRLFPAAAKANRRFFYAASGREATAGELYDALVALAPDLNAQIAIL